MNSNFWNWVISLSFIGLVLLAGILGKSDLSPKKTLSKFIDLCIACLFWVQSKLKVGLIVMVLVSTLAFIVGLMGGISELMIYKIILFKILITTGLIAAGINKSGTEDEAHFCDEDFTDNDDKCGSVGLVSGGFLCEFKWLFIIIFIYVLWAYIL